MQAVSKKYVDPAEAGSLGSISTFLSNQGYDKNAAEVRSELEELDEYNLFRPARQKFKRRKMYFSFGQYLAIDLKTLHQYRTKRGNGNNAVLLVATDPFSKKVFLRAIKDKSAQHVHDGIKSILDEIGKPIRYIFVDMGKEFYNSKVKALCKARNIHMYSTRSIVKASPAERMIRNVMSKIGRLWHLNGNKVWVPYVAQVAEGINNTVSSVTGFKPNDVNEDNEDEIWNKMYREDAQAIRPTPRYKVGDKVRISKKKINLFEKSYMGSWENEIWEIRNIKLTLPVVYELRGLVGTFYEHELQLVKNG